MGELDNEIWLLKGKMKSFFFSKDKTVSLAEGYAADILQSDYCGN